MAPQRSWFPRQGTASTSARDGRWTTKRVELVDVVRSRILPTICRFNGIKVAINYRDEHPMPHVHVAARGQIAKINIDPVATVGDELPPDVQGLVIPWIKRNKDALLRAWDQAQRRLPIEPIPE